MSCSNVVASTLAFQSADHDQLMASIGDWRAKCVHEQFLGSEGKKSLSHKFFLCHSTGLLLVVFMLCIKPKDLYERAFLAPQLLSKSLACLWRLLLAIFGSFTILHLTKKDNFWQPVSDQAHIVLTLKVNTGQVAYTTYDRLLETVSDVDESKCLRIVEFGIAFDNRWHSVPSLPVQSPAKVEL